MTEAEKRIREALAAGPTPGQWFHCQPFHRVEKMRTIHGTVPAQRVDFVATEPSPPHRRVVIPMEGRESNVRSEDMAFIAACSPENITALLADQAALRAEVERLKAAIDMQPSPPTREDMEWAGKVHLAEVEKENDALRAEVEALHRTATDRAGIIDSVREWTRGVVNDNWALRAEVEALRAERDAMAKDAEALRAQEVAR